MGWPTRFSPAKKHVTFPSALNRKTFRNGRLRPERRLPICVQVGILSSTAIRFKAMRVPARTASTPDWPSREVSTSSWYFACRASSRSPLTRMAPSTSSGLSASAIAPMTCQRRLILRDGCPLARSPVISFPGSTR